jgi:hypothetical protein
VEDHRDDEDLDEIIDQFRTAAKVERGSLLDLDFRTMADRSALKAAKAVTRETFKELLTNAPGPK